jgi:hypothetical protein
MSFFGKRTADDVEEDVKSIFGSSGKGMSKLLNMVRDSIQDRAQFEQLTAADADVDGGVSEIFTQTADKIAVVELKHGTSEWIPSVFVVKHTHMYVFKGISSVGSVKPPITPSNVFKVCNFVRNAESLVIHSEEKRHFCLSLLSEQGAKMTFSCESVVQAQEWINFLQQSFRAGIPQLMSDRETEEVARVRQALPPALLADKFASDFNIVSHVRVATSFEAALASVKGMLEWRQSNKISSLRASHVQAALAAGGLLPSAARDNSGRPIIYLTAKNIWKDGADMAGNLHAIVYCIEEALSRAEEEQFVVVVDFAGLAVRSFGERFDRVLFEVLATKLVPRCLVRRTAAPLLIACRYTGNLALFIILNAPWFMNMMWTILRPFLPVFIISKIVIFKSGSSQLHHFIDSNQVPPIPLQRHHHAGLIPPQVPQSLGGTMRHDVQAWLQTKVSEDGAVPPHSFSDAFFPQKSETKACEMPGAIFSGCMTKQGGVVKNWKKRFFVLTPGLLTYYKDKNDYEPAGAVFLQNSELFSEPGKSNPIDLKVCLPPFPSIPRPPRHVLQVPARVYHFQCDSEPDRQVCTRPSLVCVQV